MSYIYISWTLIYNSNLLILIFYLLHKKQVRKLLFNKQIKNSKKSQSPNQPQSQTTAMGNSQSSFPSMSLPSFSSSNQGIFSSLSLNNNNSSASLLSANNNIYQHLTKRFVISPHPLDMGQNVIFYLHEKLSNDKYILRILTTNDNEQRQKIQDLICKKLATNKTRQKLAKSLGMPPNPNPKNNPNMNINNLSTSPTTSTINTHTNINNNINSVTNSLIPIDYYLFEQDKGYCNSVSRCYMVFQLRNSEPLANVLAKTEYRNNVNNNKRGNSNILNTLTTSNSSLLLPQSTLHNNLLSLIQSVSLLKYYNHPHKHINPHTVYYQGQQKKFLLADPWISPMPEYNQSHYGTPTDQLQIQQYHPPQKLKQIRNQIQRYDPYVADLFSIGMLGIRVLGFEGFGDYYRSYGRVNGQMLEKILAGLSNGKLRTLLIRLLSDKVEVREELLTQVRANNYGYQPENVNQGPIQYTKTRNLVGKVASVRKSFVNQSRPIVTHNFTQNPQQVNPYQKPGMIQNQYAGNNLTPNMIDPNPNFNPVSNNAINPFLKNKQRQMPIAVNNNDLNINNDNDKPEIDVNSLLFNANQLGKMPGMFQPQMQGQYNSNFMGYKVAAYNNTTSNNFTHIKNNITTQNQINNQNYINNQYKTTSVPSSALNLALKPTSNKIDMIGGGPSTLIPPSYTPTPIPIPQSLPASFQPAPQAKTPFSAPSPSPSHSAFQTSTTNPNSNTGSQKYFPSSKYAHILNNPSKQSSGLGAASNQQSLTSINNLTFNNNNTNSYTNTVNNSFNAGTAALGGLNGGNKPLGITGVGEIKKSQIYVVNKDTNQIVPTSGLDNGFTSNLTNNAYNTYMNNLFTQYSTSPPTARLQQPSPKLQTLPSQSPSPSLPYQNPFQTPILSKSKPTLPESFPTTPIPYHPQHQYQRLPSKQNQTIINKLRTLPSFPSQLSSESFEQDHFYQNKIMENLRVLENKINQTINNSYGVSKNVVTKSYSQNNNISAQSNSPLFPPQAQQPTPQVPNLHSKSSQNLIQIDKKIIQQIKQQRRQQKQKQKSRESQKVSNQDPLNNKITKQIQNLNQMERQIEEYLSLNNYSDPNTNSNLNNISSNNNPRPNSKSNSNHQRGFSSENLYSENADDALMRNTGKMVQSQIVGKDGTAYTMTSNVNNEQTGNQQNVDKNEPTQSSKQQHQKIQSQLPSQPGKPQPSIMQQYKTSPILIHQSSSSLNQSQPKPQPLAQPSNSPGAQPQAQGHQRNLNNSGMGMGMGNINVSGIGVGDTAAGLDSRDSSSIQLIENINVNCQSNIVEDGKADDGDEEYLFLDRSREEYNKDNNTQANTQKPQKPKQIPQKAPEPQTPSKHPSTLHLQSHNLTIPEQSDQQSLPESPGGTDQNQANPKKNKGDFVQEVYQNGGKYVGYMINGQRNGNGIFYYRDGGYYDGRWKNNMMNGFGRLYYETGKLAYEGQWYEDQFHGRGVVYNDQPEEVVGEDGFDYRNMNQSENYWVYYQGDLSHDMKARFGKLMLSNGQYYQGQFKNDQVNGKGQFHRLNGRVVKGIWMGGIFIRETQVHH